MFLNVIGYLYRMRIRMRNMATLFGSACIVAACGTGWFVTKDFADNKNCLAMNIYHEARGESIEGQYAVAHVTMNRVNDRRWDDNVCDVVYQPKQFSWTHTIMDHTPKDKKAWAIANEIALATLDGRVPDNTSDSTHYHAEYVNPFWANDYEEVTQIGTHIFYR